MILLQYARSNARQINKFSVLSFIVSNELLVIKAKSIVKRKYLTGGNTLCFGITD